MSPTPPQPERTRRLDYFGPNWFATVMGTGIIALATEQLPWHFPGHRGFAIAMWLLASVLLVLVAGASVVHRITHPHRPRSYRDDPVMSNFFGARPMALLTVGAGTLAVGKDVLGDRPALWISLALWTAGTVWGAVVTLLVTSKAFITHSFTTGSAFGGWLMPLVPLLVSASTSAAIVAVLPPGEARTTMMLLGYSFLGVSGLSSMIVIALIWQRLLHHNLGAAGAVPTFWIVLGPVGQSITALHLLGRDAEEVIGQPYSDALTAASIGLGVPLWGFGMFWLSMVVLMTVKTVRDGMPFTLTWWSFTFPLATMVTGTSALAARTDLTLFKVVAVILFAMLLALWAAVAFGTVRGALDGTLLQVPPQPQPTTQPRPDAHREDVMVRRPAAGAKNG